MFKKLVFEGGGAIELSIVERFYYPTTLDEMFLFGGSGRLVGFGTGVYEEVKLTGTILSSLTVSGIGIQYDGTIMGWD